MNERERERGREGERERIYIGFIFKFSIIGIIRVYREGRDFFVFTGGVSFIRFLFVFLCGLLKL